MPLADSMPISNRWVSAEPQIYRSRFTPIDDNWWMGTPPVLLNALSAANGGGFVLRRAAANLTGDPRDDLDYRSHSLGGCRHRDFT